jgi:hypothetical protein
MKKIAILLAFAFATLVLVNSAQAEFKWEHFGGDPYAATRAEAMQRRASAFHQLGFPREVAAYFMEATKKPGAPILLTNGKRLTNMLSRGGVVHYDVLIAFVNPAVYGMGYTAYAELWTFEWNGAVYEAILPAVCQNWSSRIALPGCATISYNGDVGGGVHWHIVGTRGPLPPSRCNAQQEGNGPWRTWYGQCDWCEGSLPYIQDTILGPTARYLMPLYFYGVSETRQTLSFDPAVKQDVVSLCLDDGQGGTTCGVHIRPKDWHGTNHVEITEDMWFRNDGNCPQ